MDPISIALSLAPFIPSVVRWVAGDAAGTVAKTAVDLATTVAGVADPASAVAAIAADPQLQLQLTQAWAQQELGLFQAETERLRVEAADRADARARGTASADRLPAALALLITAGFFGLLGALAWIQVPEANENVLNIMVGTLGGSWVSVVSYYFGSSSSSAAKSKTLHELVGKEPAK